MAKQIAVLEGQQFKNKTTGEISTATSTQDVGSGKGQFLNTEQFEIITPEQGDVMKVEDFDSSTPIIPEMESPESAEKNAKTEAGSIADLTSKSILDFINQQTTAEKEREQLKGDLQVSQDTLSTKEQRLLEEEDKLGVQSNINKLQGINQQMAQIKAGLDLGIAQEEARPIARQFITGRVAEMNRQATAELGGLATMAQALQGNIYLARQTAQRTIDLEFASAEREIDNIKTLLDLNYQDLSRSDKKKADQLQIILSERQNAIDDEKEFKGAINKVLIDAIIGGASEDIIDNIKNSKSIEDAYLFATPYLQTEAFEEPITKEVDGVLLQYNKQTGGWDEVYGSKEVENGSAYTWADSISKGFAKLSDVPDNLQEKVLVALNEMPKDDTVNEAVKQKIADIDELLNSEGLAGTVGTYKFSRWTPFTADKAERKDFIAGVQQLISRDTLDTLIDLKAQGGTLGALSDQERIMLQNAASKISSWAIKDGDNVKGYEISEELFKKELNKIKDLTSKALAKSSGTMSPTQTIDDIYLNKPEYREQIDALEDKGLSDSDKLDVLGISYSGSAVSVKLQAVKADKDGEFGGQCGKYVNGISGLGLADSYEDKLAKMDPNIKYPKAGMAFVMPYSWTGHTGIILDVKDGVATVKDSNWDLDEKIKTHKIPVSNMTGFNYI